MFKNGRPTPVCAVFCVWILIPYFTFSQGSKLVSEQYSQGGSIKELTIGSIVPDITINNVINYKTTSVNLRSLRGSWVLLDFWGRTCSSCIAALPKFDSVLKQFTNVQVITVSDLETKLQVDQVLDHYKKTAGLRLPTVLKNNILRQYFPHEIISHVIWIDPNGIVQAITGSEYVTVQNVRAIMNGPVNWPVKKDVLEFDYQKPFLGYAQNLDAASKPFMYYSAFTGYMGGVDGTDKRIIDSLSNTVTKNHFNKTLLQLCDGSLNGSGTGYIDAKHLILEVKNPRRYILDKEKDFYAEWAKNNTYCYSVTLPLHLTKQQEQEFIKKDLTHWLGILNITVKKEKRLMNCLVLVRTKQDDGLLLTKGGKYEYGLNESGNVKRLTNSSLSNLVWHLNRETPNIPWVFDETGISKDIKVDLVLNLDSFENINSVRKALQPHGLDLKEEKREMEMYIITEK